MIARIKEKSRRLACQAFWKESGRVRLSIVVAALFLSVLPFIFVKGGFLIRYHLFSSRAMAATPVSASDYLKTMDKKERRRQAHAVRELIAVNPGKYFPRLLDSEIALAFAMPELQRREGTAEVWQYRSASCILDVYFQVKERSGAQVIHYEVRPRQTAYTKARQENVDAPAAVKEKNCLAGLFAKAEKGYLDGSPVVLADGTR